MNENKIKILIYLCILAIFGGIASLFVYFKNKPEDSNIIHPPLHNQYAYSDIYDINEYQTVYNCIKNYYDAINNNQKILLDLLYDEYKTNHNITLNNITNFVERKNDSFVYSINEIKKYSNIYFSFYYIVGEYSLEGLDDSLEKNIVTDILIEDIAKGTYSVLPILNIGLSFEDIVKQYKFMDYDKVIVKNDSNLLIDGTMNDFNEAMLYLNDFINQITNDCSTAYSLLGNESKKIYDSLNSFRNFCNKYQEDYVSPTIINYKTSYENGIKNILIIDNYHNKYQFFIHNVKNYDVEILSK